MIINAMLNWAGISLITGISLIIFVVSLFAVLALKEFHVNYNFKNLRRDIGNIFVIICMGKEYLAKIDGTWRLVRGWIHRGDLSAVFPPNYKIHTVFAGNWKTIYLHWDEEETEDRIAKLNITELKLNHPIPEDFNTLRRRGFRLSDRLSDDY